MEKTVLANIGNMFIHRHVLVESYTNVSCWSTWLNSWIRYFYIFYSRAWTISCMAQLYRYIDTSIYSTAWRLLVAQSCPHSISIYYWPSTNQSLSHTFQFVPVHYLVDLFTKTCSSHGYETKFTQVCSLSHIQDKSSSRVYFDLNFMGWFFHSMHMQPVFVDITQNARWRLRPGKAIWNCLNTATTLFVSKYFSTMNFFPELLALALWMVIVKSV
jgi:hypothetical protein